MSRSVSNWVDGWLRYTDRTEPPILFKKWTALSMIASALERKCYLPWGSLTFYPNMYIILVAPSGRARKGTAMSPARDILDEVPGIHLAAEAITREALIQELKLSGDEPHVDASGKQYWHASLTVHSQELTVFLGFNNYTLMSDLTDWYDCRSKWTYRTKHQGTDSINGVWLNLIGATTPELIQSSMPVDAIGLGLTSRMIFVFEFKKGKIVPDPFMTPEEHRLKELLIMDLEKIKMLHGPFQVTENFVERWMRWYPEQEDNPPFNDHRFDGYFERRPTHIMKMSMLMNVARSDSMIITEDDLLAAIEMLTQTEVKMPNVFRGLGKNSLADTLSRVMSVVGNKKEVTFAELMDTFYRDVTKEELSTILDSLVSMEFCEVVTNTGVIRYRNDYHNPVGGGDVK